MLAEAVAQFVQRGETAFVFEFACARAVHDGGEHGRVDWPRGATELAEHVADDLVRHLRIAPRAHHIGQCLAHHHLGERRHHDGLAQFRANPFSFCDDIGHAMPKR